jgi:hypothetical protein
MNGGREDLIPYWLQTTGMPSLGTTEMPTESPGVMHPWEYPWPHTSPRDMWAESMQPTPSAALPPIFPPAHLNSGKYWPVAPSVANDQPPAHGFYVSPVPQAPSWDQVPTYPADNAAPSLSQPPSPTSKSAFTRVFDASWATPTPGVNAAEDSPADKPAMAQQAFDASAKRIVRGVRGRATAPYEPPARNPEADEGEPGLIERVRLNGMDSFYRGTLTGAGRLALMQHYASTPDEAGIDPQTKRWRDQLRKEYPGVVADLARYDRMRLFENRLELGASALGQIGGGLPTPESLVGVGAKGVTWLGRAIRAGLQQGAVNAATDPVVQGLNMRAGVRDEYDPWRTAAAGVTGFVTGAGIRSAAKALGGGGAHVPKADLGAPDPSGAVAKPSGRIITDIGYEPTYKFPAHLPSDEASRMGRARDMGSTLDLYHGSNREFRSFDPAFRGESTRTPSARLGPWAAVEPPLANRFAENAVQQSGGHPQIYPLLARSDSPFTVRLTGREGEFDIVAAVMQAFDNGHDLVRLEYPKVPGQINRDAVVVKNENQLRSRFAAFDPAKRDSNDLLASLAALFGIGGLGQAAGTSDPAQPPIRNQPGPSPQR